VQAEDGIRDRNVTGVQTCALPIYGGQKGHRHRYSDPINYRALGAEYVGKVPSGIETKRGYLIDEIGVERRREIAELTIGSAQSSKPALLSVVIPIYNNGPH